MKLDRFLNQYDNFLTIFRNCHASGRFAKLSNSPGNLGRKRVPRQVLATVRQHSHIVLDANAAVRS